MEDRHTPPTVTQVMRYTYLTGMLNSALDEMREFAKKKQDGIVTATKIKILNRLLAEIKTVVAGEPSNEYLDMLSEDELPQNSDAVLILGQYKAALGSFKDRNYRPTQRGGTRWVTKEWLEQVAAQERAEAEEEEHADEDEDQDENEDERGDDGLS